MIEVVFEGRQRKCRMRRSAIVALLLLGPTSALAADPAAPVMKIFQTQCGILPRRGAGSKPYRPDAVRRMVGTSIRHGVPGFNYTADHEAKLDVHLGRRHPSTNTSPSILAPWCRDTSMIYAGLKGQRRARRPGQRISQRCA